MIQVHSWNLLYLSIVMTDGLFEQVSVLATIPCFLKKWRMSFCLLTVLLVCFLFTFAYFKSGWASTPSIVSIDCKNDPSISPFLGSMYNCSTSCLYFSINKISTHVPGIFTVTLQAISIPSWTTAGRW